MTRSSPNAQGGRSHEWFVFRAYSLERREIPGLDDPEFAIAKLGFAELRSKLAGTSPCVESRRVCEANSHELP